MPVSASRAVLRQSRFLFRRTASRRASSTTEAASNAASKAKDSASSATSKASEGLTRVTSSAGPAISGAAQGVGNALRRVGGRTGRLIAFVDSLIPPTVYYTRVGIELSKLVFQGQKMTPPNLATFQSYFQPLINAVRHPSSLFSRASSEANSVTPEGVLSRIRSMDRQQWIGIGVTTAEVIGFFTIGEMIGRFKIIGYRGDAGHGH